MKRFAALLCAALLALPWTPAYATQAGMSPCAGGTLAVTNSSANVQLSTCGPVLILYNIGSQELFYDFGPTSAITASSQDTSSHAPSTSASFSLPGNTYVVINNNHTGGFVAAITATATTTLRIIQGFAE